MELDCIFCGIVRGEKPADFVHKDESLVIFKDINPQAPVHLLIVPKKHIRGINDLAEEDKPLLSEMVFRAKETAERFATARSGYKLIFNVERGGGQLVFHLHLHLVGGWSVR